MDYETAQCINEINLELHTIQVLSHLTYNLASGMPPEVNVEEISDLLKIQNERIQTMHARMGNVIKKLGV